MDQKLFHRGDRGRFGHLSYRLIVFIVRHAWEGVRRGRRLLRPRPGATNGDEGGHPNADQHAADEAEGRRMREAIADPAQAKSAKHPAHNFTEEAVTQPHSTSRLADVLGAPSGLSP